MGQVEGVHLVGSVPLADAETVFKTMCAELPGRLRRMPDGETGERYVFIAAQNKLLAEVKGLEHIPPEPDSWAPLPTFGLAPGVSPDQLDFGNLGLADAAIESYETFARMKREGAIPANIRFQVSLYMSHEVVMSYLLRDFAKLEPYYEKAMEAEVKRIVDAIPHDQLAIQFDVVGSVFLVKGVYPAPWGEALPGVVERIARFCTWIPQDVELGFHFCFGDWGPGRPADANDARAVVTLANALFKTVEHNISWIHVPATQEGDDDAYFAPFADLQRPAGTEIYVGLMNIADGVAGAERRIDAAKKVFDTFGVATACGMGRLKDRGVTDETFHGLMAAHAAVAAPVA